MKNFSDFGIDVAGRAGVEVQTLCPRCSHARRKSKARCLSVNTVEGVWLCHHCDWRGSLSVARR
jgi:twinkle protein